MEAWAVATEYVLGYVFSDQSVEDRIEFGPGHFQCHQGLDEVQPARGLAVGDAS